MTDEKRMRYEELTKKEHLTQKEFDELEFLRRQVELEPAIAQFRKNQAASYSEKKLRAANLAWEFHNKMDGQCFVSVGGLDSITLFIFLRSIGINVPAVSVSTLEDRSIQAVHRALGIVRLMPTMPKAKVIREYGFPILSKEIAKKISTLQHPTPRNAMGRHAIITGEAGKQGGWQKGSRMRLPNKWLRMFGGYENEREGTHYGKPDFFVSDRCCYFLKEKPCDNYKKRTGRAPYMGLMASEGGRREKTLIKNGCNYYSDKSSRSCPFATFQRSDLLRLALEMDEWYQEHWREFSDERVETIIPAIYGEIALDENGELYTTGAQRTGCSMCGFGIHLEKRPHRFDQLWARNQKEWEFWMHHILQDENGVWYGWDRVLDYIGVEWRDPEVFFAQMSFEPERSTM